MSSSAAFIRQMVERLTARKPLPLMAQLVMQRLFDDDKLQATFEKHRGEQYDHKILFPVLVDLMAAVVFSFHPSVRKAWQERSAQVGASLSAVYDKLKGVSPDLCAALVASTADQAASWIISLGGTRTPLLPGRRVRILDGNHLAATERRIKALRDVAAGPLPAVTLVAYDPDLDLPVRLVGDLDAYTQERALLSTVMDWVTAGECWIGDRLFCVTWWLLAMAERKAFFVVRQHGNLTLQVVGPRQARGRTKDSAVFEEEVELSDSEGRKLRMRRVVVVFKTPTKHGEREIALLTNLPTDEVDAAKVASLYRKRWSIEGAFQRLEGLLQSELAPLGYPAAALFGFSVAVVAYQVLAVVEGALRAEHGEKKIDEGMSMHAMVEQIVRVWGGMMELLPDESWTAYEKLSEEAWLKTLRRLAAGVDLRPLQKAKRKEKGEKPERTEFKSRPHISTLRRLRGQPQSQE